MINKVDSNGEDGAFSSNDVYIINKDDTEHNNVIHILGIDLIKMRFNFLHDIKRDKEDPSSVLIYVDVSVDYILICKKVVRNGLVIVNENNADILLRDVRDTRDKIYSSKFINGEIYRKIIKFYIGENKEDIVAKLIAECGPYVFITSLQKYLEHSNEKVLYYLSRMVFTEHKVVYRRHIYIYILHYLKGSSDNINRINDTIEYIFDRNVREIKEEHNVDTHLVTSILISEKRFGVFLLLNERLEREISILPNEEKERISIHLRKTREMIKLSRGE